MKINGSHNTHTSKGHSSNTHTSNNNSRGNVAGGHKQEQVDLKPRTDAKTTDSKPAETTKTEDKGRPKDGLELSDEAKDTKKDDKKDDKCEKCEDLKGLLEALKDMFADKDEKADANKDAQQGGGDQGGGDQGGAKGGGGGGCNKSGGAAPAGDKQGGCDPISRLKEAVKKVERAQGPDKEKAIKELKELYNKTKESGVEIPELLKESIEKALRGRGITHGGPGHAESVGAAQSSKKAA